MAIGCVLATDRPGSQSNDWPNSRSDQVFGSINSNSYSDGEPNCFTDCYCYCYCYTQANPKAQTYTQAPPYARLSDDVNSSLLQLVCA